MLSEVRHAVDAFTLAHNVYNVRAARSAQANRSWVDICNFGAEPSAHISELYTEKANITLTAEQFGLRAVESIGTSWGSHLV